LAADLGVDEGDVDVLLELLDEQPPDLPDNLAGFLRDVLDPHGRADRASGACTGQQRTTSRGACTGWAGRTRQQRPTSSPGESLEADVQAAFMRWLAADG